MPGSGRLRATPARRVRRGEVVEELTELVVVEEPLEIRVEGVPTAITMRTPGDDLDLVIGFLAAEGVIDGIDDVRAIAEVGENTVDVRLAEGVAPARARSADRALYATSACGVCGKASLDRLRPPGGRRGEPWWPEDAVLAGLGAALGAAQPTYERSGGLHAAALFGPDGALRHVREDVGRHNAVDKVLGARLRAEEHDLPVGVVVTSRAGFEIVQKVVAAGVPCLVVMGAATSLAVELAASAGLGLVTWLRDERWLEHGKG